MAIWFPILVTIPLCQLLCYLFIDTNYSAFSFWCLQNATKLHLVSFTAQNRPDRRCRFIAHIADLSAWGAQRGALSRIIHLVPTHSHPYRVYPSSLPTISS